MSKTSVGVEELKGKLGECLRRVEAGETITMTEHGKTIGQVVPIKPSIKERIKTMAVSGQTEWNGQKLPACQEKLNNRGTRTLADRIMEDRD